ncbi:hypothetical protein GLOTRDRAFT_27271, partial [Gloeophyllum trabeum ATCC 11539]
TSNVSVKEIVPGRALLLTTTWHASDTISILNIYAPNDYGTQRDFWQSIQNRWETEDLPHLDFMVGDFNLVEDPIDRSPPHADPQPTADALRDTRMTLGLVAAWCTDNPSERRYTFYSSLNRFSRIDRIYSRTNHVPKLSEWYMGPSVTPTDHNLVSVRYAPANAPYIGPGRWAWPAGLIHEEALLQHITQLGRETEAQVEALGDAPADPTLIQLLWEQFKIKSKECAKKHAKLTLARMNNRIRALQRDLDAAINDPNMDTSENARTNAAILE